MLRLPTCAPRFNRSFSSTKLISKKKIKPLITRFKDSTTIMSEPSSSSTQEEDSDLVASLHVLSAKSPKLVKSSVYSSAPSDDDGSSSSIQIRSWKMNEFKYYDVPSPFPTLARGLFTREMMMQEEEEKQQQKKRYQIVVRGYDKFFNIGEVPWTTWLSLQTHTVAPYTLSLKSNGCIIFIAALTSTQLIITSKHSLGPVAGTDVSHAQAGEAWLKKHLTRKGKTEQDLAKRLWESNLTAVAELCDDSFEEHVLGYPPEKTGLHLHGLNIRSKEFKTLPTDIVDAFSDEWGFIKTPTITFDTIQQVQDFTDTCAENGEWNGEPVEGFVVRTQHVTPNDRSSSPSPSSSSSSSPYKSGSSFFFKVKFDEPYMMYRDWREVTKMLLSSKGPMNASNLPKSKMKRAETKVYVKWVIDEIIKDRASFSEYAKGKGIIATRDRFLKFLGTEEGKDALQRVNGNEGKDVLKWVNGNGIVPEEKFHKTIIVPVAIPGCGKTSVSLALAHIFGFAHTQSDDVHVKKAGPMFIKNVVDLLHKHDVVIADKNNHLTQHRQSLRDATLQFPFPIRLLALHWSLDQHPPSTIHRICADRIQQRGDNHQTLRADTSSSYEDVIWMFIHSKQELIPNEEVDNNVIEMDITASMQDSIKRAVEGCANALGLDMPCDERIKEGLEVARGYTPDLVKKKRDDDGGDEKKGKKWEARYYGLLPEIDLVGLLDPVFVDIRSSSGSDLWTALKTDQRVAKRPHVTIVHRHSMHAERDLWNRCVALHHPTTTTTTMFKGRLSHVVWNERVMAITVDDLDVVGEEQKEFVTKLSNDVKDRLHITVGTKEEKILPVEAKAMVEKWKKHRGDDGGIQSIPLDNRIVYGRIKGLI